MSGTQNGYIPHGIINRQAYHSTPGDAATSSHLLDIKTTPPSNATRPSVTTLPLARRLFPDSPQTGGKVKYEGGSYVLHTGPRGGKFIMVKGKKVYLASKQK